MERYACCLLACDQNSEILCLCENSASFRCKLHLKLHLSRSGLHIIKVSHDGNFIINLRFLNGKTIKVILPISNTAKVKDVIDLIQEIFGFSESYISLLYKKIDLSYEHSLKFYGIKSDQELVVKIFLNEEVFEDIYKYALELDQFYLNPSINTENNIVRNTLEKELLGELLLLSPSLKMNFLQIGGDENYIKIFSLLGVFDSCIYLSNSVFNEIKISVNKFFISSINFQNYLPNFSDLTLVFVFEDFEYFIELIDLKKHLVFVPSSLFLDEKFIRLNYYSFNSTIKLVKPLKDSNSFTKISNLSLQISKILSSKKKKNKFFEFQKLFVQSVAENLKTSYNLTGKPDALYTKINELILESIDQLHKNYLALDQDSAINTFLKLLNAVMCRFIIGYPRKEKKEEVLIESIKVRVIEFLLLKMYSEFFYSSLIVTLVIDVFRYYANYSYVKIVMENHDDIIEITDFYTNILIDSYKQILQNDYIVTKFLYLDDRQMYQKLLDDPESINMEEIRENELKNLRAIIPQSVIFFPLGIRLSGKTLLGGNISVSKTIEIAPQIKIKYAKMIYVLRHELSHKKNLLYNSDNKYTRDSPIVEYKGITRRESGLVTDHAIYGESDLNNLPNFLKSNDDIISRIINGERFNEYQISQFYVPDDKENQGKAMISEFYEGEAEMLCNGRSVIIS